MTRRALRVGFAAAGAALLIAAHSPLRAEDVLIRRDGGRESGKLQACTNDRCQWAGRSVPRAEIGWIGLGAPLLDRSIDTPDGGANDAAKTITEPLADGVYFWRVQALGTTGAAPYTRQPTMRREKTSTTKAT